MNSELKCEFNKLMPEHETPPFQNIRAEQKRSESHQVVPDPQESGQKTTKTRQHHVC